MRTIAKTTHSKCGKGHLLKQNITTIKTKHEMPMTTLAVKCHDLESAISFLVKDMWKHFLELMKVFDLLEWKIG